MAESQNIETPTFDQPAGIPGTFGEHAKLMFDLMVLAYETDLTRVVTFIMGREITGRTYAEVGVPDAHHPISHHQRDPIKLEKLRKINRCHVELFADFIARQSSTPEGDGTPLDHSMIGYGTGMADSNAHDRETCRSSSPAARWALGGVTCGTQRYAEDTPAREAASEPSGQDGRPDRVARRLHRSIDPRAAQRRAAAGRLSPPSAWRGTGPTKRAGAGGTAALSLLPRSRGTLGPQYSKAEAGHHDDP